MANTILNLASLNNVETFTAALTLSAAGTALTVANGVSIGGPLNMNSQSIINVLDPTTAQQVATKNYVDAGLAALNPQSAVYAATVGSNIPGTYVPVAAGIGDTFTTTATTPFTLDGTTPPLLSRILIKDQTSGYQNGIYSLTTAAVGGVSGTVFTRALDYDTPSDMNTAGMIPVINGTVNALSSWQQVATIVSIGPAGTALVFTEFTANPSLYLLKANNLSDVASKSTSFNNLSPITTTGDLIYSASGATNSRLGVGSSGQVLTVSGGVPSWQTPASAITALTGDVTATGPGSAAATLATVNSNVGTFASVTVNGKGLVTAAAALSGDATTSGSVLTLATVNSNVGTFGSSTAIPSFTVNGKGLITAASTNAVVAPAGTLSGSTLAAGVTASSLTSVGTVTTGTWSSTITDLSTLVNHTDTSKVIAFSLGGMTTAKTLTLSSSQTTSQTLTLPNITGADTLATLGLTQTFSGALTLSAASTALSVTNNAFVGGVLSVGGTSATALITSGGGSNPLSGVVQAAFMSQITGTAAGTGALLGYLSNITQAPSITTSRTTGYQSNAPTVGAGSTITTHADLYANGAAAHNATNNAALVDNVSYTGNWFINQSGTDASIFGGNVSLSKAFGAAKTTDSSTATPRNNLASSGISFYSFTGSATITINGIAAGIDGQYLLISNRTGNPLTIAHQSGSATGSQILCSGDTDITIAVHGSLLLVYDLGSSFWLAVKP